MKHKTGEFPCDTCNKSFAYKKHFDDHLLTHDVEKVSEGIKGLPKRHMKLHACDVCDKSYQRKDHLTRHRLVHSGARPHVCLVCMKSFVRKDKLQRHERIHYKEKRFQYNCNRCNRVFLRKDTLEKHKKTHSSETETKMAKDVLETENRNNSERQNTSNYVVSNTVKLEPIATSGSEVNTSSKPLISESLVTASHESINAGKLDANNISELEEMATSKSLNNSKFGVNNTTGYENCDNTCRHSEGRSNNSVVEQNYSRPQAIHTSVFEALNASQR